MEIRARVTIIRDEYARDYPIELLIGDERSIRITVVEASRLVTSLNQVFRVLAERDKRP